MKTLVIQTRRASAIFEQWSIAVPDDFKSGSLPADQLITRALEAAPSLTPEHFQWAEDREYEPAELVSLVEEPIRDVP